MKTYDCSKVLDYQHEFSRMCKYYDKDPLCTGCPLSKGLLCHNGCTLDEITEEIISLVQAWSDAHPRIELTEKELWFLASFDEEERKSIFFYRDEYDNLWLQSRTVVDQWCIKIAPHLFPFIKEGTWGLADLLNLPVEDA